MIPILQTLGPTVWSALCEKQHTKKEKEKREEEEEEREQGSIVRLQVLQSVTHFI